MVGKVSFVSMYCGVHIHNRQVILIKVATMLEMTAQTRTRDAYRAAHAARGEAMASILRWIFPSQDRCK